MVGHDFHRRAAVEERIRRFELMAKGLTDIADAIVLFTLTLVVLYIAGGPSLCAN